MTAKDLAAEYSAGRAAADAKYKGKVIEIEGKVSQLMGRAKNGKSVQEYLSVANAASDTVECEFAEKDLWKKVARGSKVKVKGMWKPASNLTFGRSALENCVFTEVGPSHRLILSADEMSAEARTNRDRFRSRFYEAELLVKGEVAAVEYKPGEPVRIVLKTSQAPRIVLETQYAPVEVEAALKNQPSIGTKVVVVGQYHDIPAQPLTDVTLFGRALKDE